MEAELPDNIDWDTFDSNRSKSQWDNEGIYNSLFLRAGMEAVALDMPSDLGCAICAARLNPSVLIESKPEHIREQWIDHMIRSFNKHPDLEVYINRKRFDEVYNAMTELIEEFNDIAVNAVQEQQKKAEEDALKGLEQKQNIQDFDRYYF